MKKLDPFKTKEKVKAQTNEADKNLTWDTTPKVTFQINNDKGRIEVTQTAYKYKNCFAQAYYEVAATYILEDADWEMLRNDGAFMRGQVCGRGVHNEDFMGTPWTDMYPIDKEEGIFFYRAYSCCDSGD